MTTVQHPTLPVSRDVDNPDAWVAQGWVVVGEPDPEVVEVPDDAETPVFGSLGYHPSYDDN